MDVVYRTGVGRICAGCRRPSVECVCKDAKGRPKPSITSRDKAVVVGRQTQGRAGRGVTVISGLALPPAELVALAGELKRLCGSGGTVRGEVIEIQGEHRDGVVAELTRRGIRARRSGG